MEASRPRPLSKSLYAKLLPRPNGPGREEVISHQRGRLYGAMTESLARHGYAATSMTELCKLAGVSTRTAYQLFAGKEAYFLETFDAISARAVKHVCIAYHSEGDGQARLHRALGAFASEVVNEPKAARLVLVEALGASPAAMARLQRARVSFERMIGASLSEGPDGVALPPLLLTGIVRGVEGVTRQRLLAGGVEELPALTDELLAWILRQRSPAAAALLVTVPPPRSFTPSRPSARAQGERVRVQRAAAQIVARGGYAHLTAGQIAHEANVSEETFQALYSSTEQCFMDALDRAGLEALVCMATAAKSTEDRLAGVHLGLTALMGHLAGDSVLARLMFIEALTVGAAGIQCRERLFGQFTDLLVQGLPQAGRPSRLVTEASSAAIWGIVDHHAARDATRLLPDLANYATYIALAPVIGGERAMQVIRAGEGEPSSRAA